MQNLTDEIKKSIRTPGGIITAILYTVWTVFLAFHYAAFGPAANKGSLKGIPIFFGLLVLLIAALFFLLSGRNSGSGKKPLWQLPLYTAFFGVFWHFQTEYIVNTAWRKIRPVHQLMSMAISAAVFLILILFFQSLKWAASVGSLFYYVFALAEYYTIAFRSIPVMYSDLTDIGAAAAVVGNYDLSPTKQILIIASVLLIILSVILTGPDLVPGKKLWTNAAGRLLAVLMAAALVVGIGHSNRFTQSVGTLFRPLKSFYQYGSQLAFIQSIKNAQIDRPEGYNTEEIRQLAADYSSKADAYNAALPENTEKPNIIAIMNESFCDPDVTGANDLAKELMPFYNGISENTVKGKVMVSTFGGGTGRSEFEFNTGSSMHLFDLSTSPYALFGQRMQDALASQLKEEGYQTIAIHPYVGSNYNRPRTYAAMGFDSYLTRDDMEDAETIRKYISDRAVYDRINSFIDEKEEPVFAFTVTMQNHGDYQVPDYPAKVSVLDGRYPEADQFLTLIHESDSELEELIEHYSKSSEKTIIVLFGDHLPSLPNAFYEEYNGFTKDSAKLEEQVLYYQTSYMIWANYDIPEEEKLTSLNYLGLHLLEQAGSQLTPYQIYLKELEQKIPAFSAYGWFGTDGQYHSWGSDAEKDELVRQFDAIEYNRLVDVSHRVAEFYRFGITSSNSEP